MKIDCHVHSMHSKRPSYWILKKIGCPESFTEPRQIYRVARERGMTAVTITDHNCIDGALEIAHLPGAFVSEEVTSYFPDDQCKLHILALNISEDQHREIQRLRPDVFELTAYFHQENIFHILAHPLYSLNRGLSPEHFEKMLLLFQNFELNGARNERENLCLQFVAGRLTPGIVSELADKHGITPRFSSPWRKRLFGGSDDHSSLNIARTYTEIEGAPSAPSVFADIDRHAVRIHGRPSDPKTFAHNLYGIAYQFYRRKFNLGPYAHRDMLLGFLDRSLRVDVDDDARHRPNIRFFPRRGKKLQADIPVSDSIMTLLKVETRKLIENHPDLFPAPGKGRATLGDGEIKWFDFVDRVSNRLTLDLAASLVDQLASANFFDIFRTIGSAGSLYTLLAPYFIAYSVHTKDREFSRSLRRNFGDADGPHAPSHQKDRVNMAHFTDTFDEVNGVAKTLRQQVKLALKLGKKLTIITCGGEGGERLPGVRNFKPVGACALPEYPEQQIVFPPLLEMLDYCYRQGFSVIHAATPGPSGLAALAIARILKLPVCGTYHTAIPQYARALTGDGAIEEMIWKYTLWFYNQLDTIYAPSASTREELIAKGIRAAKIQVYPRGIDIERFHPAKRNGYLTGKLGVASGTTLIYVGRVSREKNLPLLLKAFGALVAEGLDLHLVVVGDGPYMAEMKAAAEGLPCTFPGYMGGEDLACVYASSDIFVFPSTTDTFGNVVLEAQASGIPVIVTDRGGPRENLLPGETGVVVRADDAESLGHAMRHLATDRPLRERMGRAARRYVEDRSFQAAFAKTWEMYAAAQPVPGDAPGFDIAV